MLKCLAEDGELALADGRTLCRRRVADPGAVPDAGDASNESSTDDEGSERDGASRVVVVHEAFRLIVMANRPGFPFLGNDFYRECGDVFAAHAVESCAFESELRLLKAVAPRAPDEALVDASLLWRDLRGLVDDGRLGYPYSTRELVKVAKHLDAYPADGLGAACGDVFAFDAFDARLAALLASVLEGHGVDADAALGGGEVYGDMTLKLPKGFKTVKRPGAPAGMPTDGPKHGKWDDEAHMGGNMFAGGSGGSGTAGLGGRGGPYRLDVGQQLGHMTQAEKDSVDDASLAAAKDMATKAHAKRLEELGFGPAEAKAYEAARDAVLLGATELRAALLDRETRDRERVRKTGQEKGDPTSIQRGCSRNDFRGKRIHALGSPREMIARPKMSQIEWKTIEILVGAWKCLTLSPPGLEDAPERRRARRQPHRRRRRGRQGRLPPPRRPRRRRLRRRRRRSRAPLEARETRPARAPPLRLRLLRLHVHLQPHRQAPRAPPADRPLRLRGPRRPPGRLRLQRRRPQRQRPRGRALRRLGPPVQAQDAQGPLARLPEDGRPRPVLLPGGPHPRRHRRRHQGRRPRQGRRVLRAAPASVAPGHWGGVATAPRRRSSSSPTPT